MICKSRQLDWPTSIKKCTSWLLFGSHARLAIFTAERYKVKNVSNMISHVTHYLLPVESYVLHYFCYITLFLTQFPPLFPENRRGELNISRLNKRPGPHEPESVTFKASLFSLIIN